jgi:glycosyltransferase involved in cell wall biosynthesis
MLDYGFRQYWGGRPRRYEPLILLGNGPVCPGMAWHILRHGSEYDLIHISQLHYAHAALAFGAARRRHVPIVVTPHLHIEQPATYDVRYMQAILLGSDHVLADTEAERQFLLGVGFEPGRVTTAGIGIRMEEFPTLDRLTCRDRLGVPEQAYVLLFLGRKTEYKGLELVLQAFAALQRQNTELYLAAVGPDTDYSNGLFAQYATLPRLINYGSVTDETRLVALNACDCLVMPSTGEAFGIVFLEAWAMGKPVIAAETEAVSTIVSDGRDGYLVPPGDVGQLADRILRLTHDRSLGYQMGQRGRSKVLGHYTVPRVTDIIEGVYLRALRRRSRYHAAVSAGTWPSSAMFGARESRRQAR